MKKVFQAVLAMLILSAGVAAAADDSSWLQIGGDYRFRYDSLKGTVHDYVQATPPATLTGVSSYSVKNDSLLLNRFGLNLRAEALEDVVVKARFVMYKVWGRETSDAALGNFFADRFGGTNDGTVGHVPQDNTLRVDYAYATVSNLFGAPAWFSVGRRPSTGGIPGNIRQDQEKIGTAGVPNLLVDYAFDGATLGYAPYIGPLPGAFVKLCYGRGFDTGFQKFGDSLENTDFYGINAALLDTENTHIELQYQKGVNIFDRPPDGSTITQPAPGGGTTTVNFPVTADLGDIDWLGGVVMGRTGGLNLFASAAQSKTKPNGQTSDGLGGLLFDANTPPASQTGYAMYLGARYDFLSTGTKIGAEYNHGSRYWVGMVPAGDDIWTSKLGTRGSVYELYVIQELSRKPISKKGKAFVRLGYQYYKFDFTGSNNWVGTPQKIADLTTTDTSKAQFFAPLKDAKDLYFTFDVLF
jgi:hypothetical protein